MITIEREWKSLEETCLPKDAGPMQRREMKRAFYAGAAAILTAMAEYHHNSYEVRTALAAVYLEELENFTALIQAGEA